MILKIHPDNPNRREMNIALKMLRDGAIIIYPTDTLYAIGCDALNVRAVERICRIKGIDPYKNNLSIIFNDFSNLSEYAKVSDKAFKLMKKNLPGPFTFILPAGSRLPKIYRSRKEVGIRIPDNTIARILVEELGNPILSMSIGSEPAMMDEDSIKYPELIHEKYENIIDLVIDGGEGSSVPSAIINCVSQDFEIIREGAREIIF